MSTSDQGACVPESTPLVDLDRRHPHLGSATITTLLDAVRLWRGADPAQEGPHASTTSEVLGFAAWLLDSSFAESGKVAVELLAKLVMAASNSSVASIASSASVASHVVTTGDIERCIAAQGITKAGAARLLEAAGVGDFATSGAGKVGLTHEQICQKLSAYPIGVEHARIWVAIIMRRLVPGALAGLPSTRTPPIPGPQPQRAVGRQRWATPPALFWLGLVAIFIVRTCQWHYAVDDASPAASIARGSGLSITAAMVVVFLSKSNMLSWVAPKRLQPMFDATRIHAHAGVAIAGFGAAHTVAHFIYQGAGAFNSESGIDAEVARCGLPPAVLTVTGLALTVMIAAMTVTATRRVQAPGSWRWFIRLHHLYYLIAPVLLVHACSRWYVLGTALALWLANKMMIWSNEVSGTLSSAGQYGAQISFLTLPRRTENRPGVPGSIYRLNIPSIARYEWHPFSICNTAPSDSLEFLAKGLGWWTNAVNTVVDNPLFDRTTKLNGRGPFWSPLVYSLDPNRSLLICNGIGVTPFIAMVESCVARHIKRCNEVTMRKQVFKGPEKRAAAAKASSVWKRRPSSLTGAGVLPDGGDGAPRAPTRRPPTMDDPDAHEAAENAGAREGGIGRTATLVWVLRDFKLLDHLMMATIIPLLNQQDGELEPAIRVEIYYTGHQHETANPAMALYLSLCVMQYGKAIAAIPHRALKLAFYRPNFDAIVARGFDRCFFCGSGALAERLERTCDKVQIPFVAEEFQNLTFARWAAGRHDRIRGGAQVAAEEREADKRSAEGVNAVHGESLKAGAPSLQ